MKQKNPMMPWYRVLRVIALPFVRLLCPTKIVGRENIPEEGSVILCCNHTSFSDVFLLATTCRRQIYFMAKEELYDHRLLGWIMTKLGAFAVSRTGGGKEAIQTGQDVIQRGDIMGIFPEGKRNFEGPPIRAKLGVAYLAATTGAPVLPACIYRPGRFRFFKKSTLRFGAPIPPEELQIDPEHYRQDLRRVSETIMGQITKMWEMGA